MLSLTFLEFLGRIVAHYRHYIDVAIHNTVIAYCGTPSNVATRKKKGHLSGNPDVIIDRNAIVFEVEGVKIDIVRGSMNY